MKAGPSWAGLLLDGLREVVRLGARIGIDHALAAAQPREQCECEKVDYERIEAICKQKENFGAREIALLITALCAALAAGCCGGFGLAQVCCGCRRADGAAPRRRGAGVVVGAGGR